MPREGESATGLVPGRRTERDASHRRRVGVRSSVRGVLICCVQPPHQVTQALEGEYVIVARDMSELPAGSAGRGWAGEGALRRFRLSNVLKS